MLKLSLRSGHIPALTGKPERQRFTMWSLVLTYISSRQRSAISDRPLPERTVMCNLL